MKTKKKELKKLKLNKINVSRLTDIQKNMIQGGTDGNCTDENDSPLQGSRCLFFSVYRY